MYAHIDEHNSDERKEGQTDEQFHYKLRKKAWGPFKKQLWELPEETRATIRESLTDRFGFLFKELNVIDTQDLVNKTVTATVVPKTEADFAVKGKVKDVKGLDD